MCNSHVPLSTSSLRTVPHQPLSHDYTATFVVIFVHWLQSTCDCLGWLMRSGVAW
jgi:hypothetical protein